VSLERPLVLYFPIKGPNWNRNKQVCLKTQEKESETDTEGK